MKTTICAFLVLFSIADIFAQIPGNGLVAFFPFNGNAKDSSSRQTHGTVYNASLTTDRFGNLNSAYQFSGNSNSYIEFPSTYLLNNKFTYSIWAKVNAIPSIGEYTYALNIGSTAGDQGLDIANYAYTVMNGWVAGCYNTVAPNFGANQNKDLSTAVWSHVVCVRDSNFVQLYIDGVLVDSVGSSTNKYPYYGTGPVIARIGKRNDGSRPFNGKIDDVCIYNRALSKAEVMQLFNDQSTSIATFNVNRLHVNLYPNPSRADFSIELNHKGVLNHALKIKIYNSLGQEITDYKMSNLDNAIRIDHELTPGLYSVFVYTLNGNLQTIEKLIVN